METKRAFITGITGQDGSYLADFLLENGYEVSGLVRRLSTPNMGNIRHMEDKITLFSGDLLDQGSLSAAIKESKPHEVYNLASQSFVGISWKQPAYTSEATAIGAIKVLEAIRAYDKDNIKFYQASSSEMFGNVKETPQTEKTPFYPRSPYGVAKVAAHWTTVNYRESYGMFATSGILFNHESPRRGIEFVTRKVSTAAAKIKLGLAEDVSLGNLSAKRDWGYAGDYVKAMWLMLQNPTPEDYVIATGEDHSVKEFAELAFDAVGIKIKWEGEDVDEVGIDEATGKTVVKVDPKYFRPAEVNKLRGDASLAKKEIGWEPTVKFPELVKKMVDADIKILESKL